MKISSVACGFSPKAVKINYSDYQKSFISRINEFIFEACIGVLGIQDVCHFTSRSILLPGIWDTVFNIFVTFRDIEYLGKLTMGIFANL